MLTTHSGTFIVRPSTLCPQISRNIPCQLFEEIGSHIYMDAVHGHVMQTLILCILKSHSVMVADTA